MKINPIKFHIAFRGEKDEDQPLATGLKDVFSDKSVPNTKQRFLWELSEVPNFYKVSKDMTKDEFIKLADYVREQDTNILEMALKGDVRIVRKGSNSEKSENSFFTFAPLVRYNKNAQNNLKKGLFEYIKEHPIFKIIDDVIESYKEDNTYPNVIPYKIQKDENGDTVYKPVDYEEATLNVIENTLISGNPFRDKDAIIIFKDKIKGKNDFKCSYTPVDPSKIEEPYPIVPECIKFLLSIPLESNIRDTICTLSKIPYFNNLIKSNHPMVLVELARMNAENNNIFVKMFEGDIKMGIFEPETRKEIERPIIDIGQLLTDMRQKKIKSNNMLSALADGSFALETFAIYKSFKDIFPNEKIKYVLLRKIKQELVAGIVTNSDKKCSIDINSESKYVKRLCDYIDKVPYKMLSINYNEK